MEAPTQTFVWNWKWNCDPATAPPGPGRAVRHDGDRVELALELQRRTAATRVGDGATVCVACNIAVSVRSRAPATPATSSSRSVPPRTAGHGHRGGRPGRVADARRPGQLPALPAVPRRPPPRPPRCRRCPRAPPTVLPAVAPGGRTRRAWGLTAGQPRCSSRMRTKVAAPSRLTERITAAGTPQSGIAAPALVVERHACGCAHPAGTRRRGAAPARAPFRGPCGPAPSDPLPRCSRGSLSGSHGGGTNANAALTTMTLAGLLLVFLSRIRSIARPRRRAGPVTQPHPPG